jgi:hypothetical protein
MKPQIVIMRVVERASFFVAKRERTWVRFSFSSFRLSAAEASVRWVWDAASQALRSAMVTVWL